MKKILAVTAILVPALLAGGYLAYHNLPSKRYQRHMIKARLFLKENNSTAAQLEYEKAYNAVGKYTPYASYEVLGFTNNVNLRERKVGEAIANTRMFIRENPKHKDAKVALAELAFLAGETETAFDAIDQALAADPYHFPARLLLARVRTRLGRLDLAEEQVRFLYKKYPDSIAALLPLAENLLLQGRASESRDFLVQALEDHPRNTGARALLLDSYLLERKVDSAQGVLDAWTAANPELALPIQIRKARLHNLLGQDSSARAALAPFLDKRSENLAAYTELALLHARNGRYDSAIKVYQGMRENAGTAGQAIDPMMVLLHLRNQNPARALELLKVVRMSSPGSGNQSMMLMALVATGQDNKAEALIEQQPDSARPALKAFLAQVPRDREFLGQWALVNYYTANRLPYLALVESEKLFKRWPKAAMARTLYASKLAGARRNAEAAQVLEGLENPTLGQRMSILNFHAHSGNRAKAIALAEKLKAENPDMPGLNLMLADFAWSAKEKEKGIALYERELAINPENALALNNLAWEFGVVRKDLAKAKPYLDRLEKHKRLDPRIMDTIGWILAMNGKAKEAETYLRTALHLEPDHPAFLYHLAFALNLQGNKSEARTHVSAALASKRPFEERKAAETLLAELG